MDKHIKDKYELLISQAVDAGDLSMADNLRTEMANFDELRANEQAAIAFKPAWYDKVIEEALKANDIDMANSLKLEKENFVKIKSKQILEDQRIKERLAESHALDDKKEAAARALEVKPAGRFTIIIFGKEFSFGWKELIIAAVILILLMRL